MAIWFAFASVLSSLSAAAAAAATIVLLCFLINHVTYQLQSDLCLRYVGIGMNSFARKHCYIFAPNTLHNKNAHQLVGFGEALRVSVTLTKH